jgi:hypothetical protein
VRDVGCACAHASGRVGACGIYGLMWGIRRGSWGVLNFYFYALRESAVSYKYVILIARHGEVVRCTRAWVDFCHKVPAG